jgi:hypothetical protein
MPITSTPDATSRRPHVHSVGPGTDIQPDTAGPDRSRWAVVSAGLLLALAVAAGVVNWRSSADPSVAGDVPDSPGVDRQVDGLHVLNAYLVPGARRGAFAVVADFVTSSGGSDRLLAVSTGRAETRVDPKAPGNSTPAGLPVGSDHLVEVGPETGAQSVTVTGVTQPRDPGTLVRATFSFARRGPVSVLVPIWASLSGPAGPS